ncbi:MAG: hypothetical protein PVH87_08685, partial [Desulfobacteraceae bacterium]
SVPALSFKTYDGGWPRQQVAWVAQQQEEQLTNRFDIDLLRPNQQKLPVPERIDRFLSAAAQPPVINEDLPAFGHRQFLPVPPAGLGAPPYENHLHC